MNAAAVPQCATCQSAGHELDEGDLSRPLLLGYIRRELVATDAEVHKLERQMSIFAQAEGFWLGGIFVDEPTVWPAGFEVLTDAVCRHNATAVVLPSLLHFAVLGAGNDIRGTFERATGARVLLFDSGR
jgi:hypothetical protein